MLILTYIRMILSLHHFIFLPSPHQTANTCTLTHNHQIHPHFPMSTLEFIPMQHLDSCSPPSDNSDANPDLYKDDSQPISLYPFTITLSHSQHLYPDTQPSDPSTPSNVDPRVHPHATSWCPWWPRLSTSTKSKVKLCFKSRREKYCHVMVWVTVTGTRSGHIILILLTQ